MKKKLVLISAALFLALTVSVGTYAYTYTTATATIGLTVAGEEIATYESAPDQPVWDDVLPWGESDQEILLPDDAGSVTHISHQCPPEGEHWDKVAEEYPDDWSTYVYTSSKKYKMDLYNLTDHIDGEGDINGVTVYFRFSGDPEGAIAYAKAAIKTGGKTYEGNEESQAGQTFATRAYTWTTNPRTGNAWTWNEIDALEAGIKLKKDTDGNIAACTQVGVMVDYEVMIIEGEAPMGELYIITPHTEYPGDLHVKIYITNTNDLIKAYQHLNMKLYVEDSIEASMTPDYQVLSLENGVAAFNIVGGTATANYTVEVIGGSYRMISDDAYQWGEGWTHIPEFYCEVTQK